jgi:hypothetical protein
LIITLPTHPPPTSLLIAIQALGKIVSNVGAFSRTCEPNHGGGYILKFSIEEIWLKVETSDFFIS